MKWQRRSRAHAPGAEYWGVTDEMLVRWHTEWINGSPFRVCVEKFRAHKRKRLRNIRSGDLINEWRRLGLSLPARKWRKMRAALEREMDSLTKATGLERWVLYWAMFERMLELETEEKLVPELLTDTLREVVGDAEMDRKQHRLTLGGLVPKPEARIVEPRTHSSVRTSEPGVGYQKRPNRSLKERK